jgi:hypothetical protein
MHISCLPRNSGSKIRTRFREPKHDQQGGGSGIWQRARILLYMHLITIYQLTLSQHKPHMGCRYDHRKGTSTVPDLRPVPSAEPPGALAGAQVIGPALYIASDRDPVTSFLGTGGSGASSVLSGGGFGGSPGFTLARRTAALPRLRPVRRRQPSAFPR